MRNIQFKFINGVVFYLLLIIFGFIWGLGQYKEFFYFRFIGFIPILYIIFNRKHYLLEILLFGWIAYIINFYWLYITFHESGKLPFIFAAGIPVLLCLYYAAQYVLIALILKKSYLLNKNLIYSFPIIFVFIDFLYPKLFTHSIADSQFFFPYFVQMIDLTGMSGLILIIMSINLGLFLLITRLIKKAPIKPVHFIFILPFVIACIYGYFRLDYLNRLQKTLMTTKASMIQGNISGKQKLLKSSFEQSIDRYNGLTIKAVKDATPDFIIWPESVFTHAYDGNPENLKRMILINRPPLIMGISTWRMENDKPAITNSCLLIKDKQEIARYDKRHLLAFGEYIPFVNIFPFFKKLTPLSYSMKRGNTPSIFNIDDIVHACLSICFEDIFSDEIRKKVNEGCNLMINITNDSWYGKGLGPLHHSILARLRAIENRRSFYRCTATGLTTASDLTGRVLVQGQEWDEEVVTARLPLYNGRTVYSYIGESLSYLCVLITSVLIIILFIRFITKKRVKIGKPKKKIHWMKREIRKKMPKSPVIVVIIDQ